MRKHYTKAQRAEAKERQHAGYDGLQEIANMPGQHGVVAGGAGRGRPPRFGAIGEAPTAYAW